MSRYLVPDVTKPIVAARTWEGAKPQHPIPGLPTRQELRSGSSWMHGHTSWPVAETLEARCTALYDLSPLGAEYMERYREAHQGGVPAEGCSCGVYAVSDPYGLEQYAGYGDRVFGVVSLWGRVIPGAHGWRAQFAKVAGILGWGTPDAKESRDERNERDERNALLEEVARWYDVPLFFRWPELTQPEEVVRWTSAASSR